MVLFLYKIPLIHGYQFSKQKIFRVCKIIKSTHLFLLIVKIQYMSESLASLCKEQRLKSDTSEYYLTLWI